MTPDMLTSECEDPVPETLLPSLVREVRRTRRRRAPTWWPACAAATVVTVALGALAAGGSLDGNADGTPAGRRVAQP